jgi:hypothetical protein
MLSAIIPNARIMSWGYDANTHSTKGLSAMYLYDHAQKLVSDLSLHRRLDKVGKPFMIIGSLGLRLLTTMADGYTAHHFRCPQSRGNSSQERKYVSSDQATKPNKNRRSFTPTLRDPIICILINLSRRLHMVSCSWVLLTKEARG